MQCGLTSPAGSYCQVCLILRAEGKLEREVKEPKEKELELERSKRRLEAEILEAKKAKDDASSFKQELEEKEKSKNDDIWMRREIRSLKWRLGKFEREEES